MRALVAALAVVAVVGIGPTPPALGQETLFRVDELAAFDGTGKRLGALAPIVNAFRPTRVTVLFRVGAARPAPVDFSRDGFFAEPKVAFTTRDCTGQAYRQADAVSDGLDGLLRRAMPVGPRGTFYVQSGPGQWQRIRSELNTFTGRCRGNDYDARVAPAEPRGPDLADYVMPPYSVRATVGPALSALTPDEPLAETDRLVVYDSAAKKLGTTAYDEPWTGHAVHVAFVTGSGGIVLVEVARSRLTSDVRPYFATTDCTGQA